MVARAGVLNLYSPRRWWFKHSSSSSKHISHLFSISCSNQNPPLLSPSLVSSNLNKTLSQIQTSGVIACLRAPSAELALGAAHAALDSGISVLEVVASCPGVFQVIQELVRKHPTKTIGVGTVLNGQDAQHAIQSGAKFLMSPAMVQEVFDNVQGTEVLYIPGVMTPTEILCTHNAGAKIVKIYPVSALGGAQYIGALMKPFSHIPMVASQGITIDLIPEYIARGTSAVVISDAIFNKNAVFRRDFKTISKLASHASLSGNEAVKQFKLVQEFSGH